ncbi:unnamed protein product, partial [Heterotrigona itama]
MMTPPSSMEEATRYGGIIKRHARWLATKVIRKTDRGFSNSSRRASK